VQVDQAIFTSVQSGRVQGYQLAARSDGIDDRLAQMLTQWGPSHGALSSTNPAAESLNFHPLDDDRFALSRTIYGGPEYSRRGGLQLMTRYALLDRRYLEQFAGNAMALMRLARTEGHFSFVTRFELRLPPLNLPDFTPSVLWSSTQRPGQGAIADEVVGRLSHGERIALTHCLQPPLLLQQIVLRLKPPQRLELSFTTGLKPTAHRPFRLHFLPGDSAELRRSAAALGLTCLSASR